MELIYKTSKLRPSKPSLSFPALRNEGLGVCMSVA